MAYTLQTLKPELEQTRPSFEEMALSHTSFNKEMEFAIQAFQTNATLLTMEPTSVKNCLVNVALSGLTLNPVMKMAYLVPRKGKCCLDPSYVGLIKIITDTGSVISIKGNVVYSNEPFDIELGSDGFVTHKPNLTGKDGRGQRIGAYSIAKLNEGSYHVDWMYESELMAIKARAQKTGGAVWNSDEDEMCKKTVIKRHWKQLPKSDRAILAAQAIAFDDENNGINFAKESKKGLVHTLDTTYEEIATSNIPEEITRAVTEAKNKKEAHSIWVANPDLHQFPEMADLIQKKYAEIDLLILQKKSEDAKAGNNGDK